MTANITELAACPFCGGEPYHYAHGSGSGEVPPDFVACTDCGANVHITAWNTRTPDITAMKERIEALETGLHQYRNDMMWPPEDDSRERRIAMIDALIGGAP